MKTAVHFNNHNNFQSSPWERVLEEKTWFSRLISEFSEVVFSKNILLSKRKLILPFGNIPKLNYLRK